MDCPWSDHFQLGIVVPAFYPQVRERKGPVVEVVEKLAADPFFQALEFSGAEEPALQRKLAAVARGSGKSLVFSGGAYCRMGQHNLHDLEADRRESAVRQVRRIIDEADEYGCKVLYVMGFEAPASPEDRARARESLARSLAELSDYARSKNPGAPLTLSMENFHRLAETPFLIGPTVEFAGMLRRMRQEHPNLGLTFDTSHILQLSEDLPATFGQVQDVIAHVHLSNCLIRDPASPFYGDKHPPYGLPGSEIGAPELAAFLRAAEERGHFSRTFPGGKPVFSLEVITPAGQDPDSTLCGAKEAFLEAWKIFSPST